MKELTKPVEQSYQIDAYLIDGWLFNVPDPNNLANGARLEITYSLARKVKVPDGEGALRTFLVRSPNPEQIGIKISLYDRGRERALTGFLLESGERREFLDFGIRDIRQLVETDIRERFKIEV